MLQNILQFLLGIGVFQSLILGVLLLILPAVNKYITKLTAIILLITSLLIISELLGLYGFQQSLRSLLEFTILLDLLLVVLIWWLSLFIIGERKVFHKKDLLHVLPFALGFIWLRTGFNWFGNEAPGTFSHIPDAVGIMVAYKSLVWCCYMGMSIKVYAAKTYPDSLIINSVKKRLLNILLWPFIAISFISLFSFWFMFFGFQLPLVDSDILSVLLVVCFVYYLTFTILREPGHFIRIRQNSLLPKYYKSRLHPRQSTNHLDRLQAVLEHEKPFLDKKLSLSELSETLDIPSNTLSQLINEQLGMSFHDLINAHRLKEIKAKLLDPSEDRKTILALAFESGFQSKASFNRIFKKSEGMTPSYFRSKYRSQPTF